MIDKVRIELSFENLSLEKLSDRANRMLNSRNAMRLTPLEKSVQFLRGVDSRASFTLAGFYMFSASGPDSSDECLIEGYPGRVFKRYINHSSLNSISLACRKAFDHSVKNALTGAVFAKTPDCTLRQHAEYWAKYSGRPAEDSYQALDLLRSFFKLCSKSNNELLRQESTLGRRIALLKQHADRAASHLSLEAFEFDFADVSHVVASLTLIGEIVRSFDRPYDPANFYNDLDAAAHSAAKLNFPNLFDFRLFQKINIERQARLCWQRGKDHGLHMLLEQIPYATGFF